MTYNAVTLTANGSLIRWGGSDFLNDGTFDGGTETYTTDVGHKIQGLELKYHKIVGGILAEMTQGEKDTVDGALIVNLSLISNYYVAIFPKGEQETLISDGAISLVARTTSLDVAGSATMTLADAPLNGIYKKIFNEHASDATITCSLDQTGGAFVSFTIANKGKAEIFWDNKGGFWSINQQKNLTKNL